jgi:thiosulfate/3-mercaptopyruvate sulfurtransferase
MTAFRATGMMTAAVAAIGLLGFTAAATAQQDRQQSPFPDTEGPVNWVTTDWLEQNLDNPDLVIIDTQPDVHDYFAEHIPGAVYLNDTVLRAPENGIPAQYVPEDVIRTLFQRIGVKADQPVVVYTGTGAFTGDTGDLEQTMMAYTLARFGHDTVYLLDGGFDKWRDENRPVTQEFPQVQESSLNTSVQEDMFLTYDRFLEMHGQDNVVLLDARPYDLYAGEGPWSMEGHIPGAVNLPWRDLMAQDNPTLLKPREEIQAMLDELGISPDQTIIVSCGTGREATNEYLILSEYLGYPNVVLFEGSFTEWTAHPENETVTGANPS